MNSEVSQTFVNRISEQAERLNTLILELLELARIESGEHIYHVDTVDINEVLRASVDAHRGHRSRPKPLILKCRFYGNGIAGDGRSGRVAKRLSTT